VRLHSPTVRNLEADPRLGPRTRVPASVRGGSGDLNAAQSAP